MKDEIVSESNLREFWIVDSHTCFSSKEKVDEYITFMKCEGTMFPEHLKVIHVREVPECMEE